MRSRRPPAVLVWLAAAVCAMAGCAPAPGATDRASAGARQVLDAPVSVDRVARRVTVRVRNRACGELRTGSGVVVDDDLIVTNRHVVEGAQEVQINTWDGRSLDVSVSEVAADSDLGLLRVDGDLPTPVVEATDELAVGDPATVAGYPGGDVLEIDDGAVLGRADDVLDEPEPVLVVDTPVQPGNSGGPVLTDDGQLAGIVFAADVENQTALAIPLARYQQLREEASFAEAPSCGELGADDPAPVALGELTLPPPPPTTVPVPCPTGEPEADVDDVSVTPVAGDPTRWTVTASGALVNATSAEATVRDARLQVGVSSGSGAAAVMTELPVSIPGALPGGGTAPWTVQGEVSSATAPSPSGLMFRWLWSDPGLRLRCS